MTTTTHRTGREAIPGPTSPLRRRAHRWLAAVLGPMSLLIAVGCGFDQAAPDAPAPMARAASAHGEDDEPDALDNTEQNQQRRLETSLGSDRHFGLIAEQVAQARIRATEGSDRHLELLASELAATDRD
jgi:hypothetical protein